MGKKADEKQPTKAQSNQPKKFVVSAKGKKVDQTATQKKSKNKPVVAEKKAQPVKQVALKK